MPAGLSHYILARSLVENFEKKNQNCDASCVLFGAQVPDLLYLYTFWKKSEPNLGVFVHRHNDCAVFESFRRHADSLADDSFVYGYLSHYAFDITVHPYVYWLENRYLAEEDREKKSKFHFRIEADLDVFLYRKFFGEMYYSFPYAEESDPGRENRTEIYLLLRDMFREVFRREVDRKKFERSWANYLRFNRIKADPLFWKRKFLLTAENLFGLRHTSSMMLQRKDPDERVLNLAHEPWQNPFETGSQHTEDFFALFERALALAEELCGAFDRGEIDGRFGLHLLHATPPELFSEEG